jgi:hypothetical protein
MTPKQEDLPAGRAEVLRANTQKSIGIVRTSSRAARTLAAFPKQSVKEDYQLASMED